MSKAYLRRYTDLPALFYLLRERQITLLDPQSWDDKNDSYYLRLYQEKKNLKSVLALCFTQAGETYHHWRVFANGSSGVCIRFNRKDFLKFMKKQSGLQLGSVRYLKLNQAWGKKVETRDLPFLKRFPFQDEKEFRLVYESEKEEIPKLDIPISLSIIYRIHLSPWLPSALSTPVREMLKSIEGCSGLDIQRSTLISNENWKSFGESAT